MNNYSWVTFLPLIGLYALAFLITLVKAATFSIWDARVFMATFMGAIFILFGCVKIINLKAFAYTFAEYDLIAKQSRLYALAYPFIEIGLGYVYIVYGDSHLINSVTLCFMLVNAAGVLHALLQKKLIACACMGTVFKLPMTYVTLAEDLFMVLMALGMLLM